MKKILIGLALVAALGSSASAQLPTMTQYVTEVLRSTSTCFGMSISNSAGIELLQSSVTPYTYVSVESEDATANVFCNERADVAISGTKRGKKVRPSQTITWVIVPSQPFYCISDGGAATNIMLCKGR